MYITYIPYFKANFHHLRLRRSPTDPRFCGVLALSAQAPLRVRGARDVALLEVTTTATTTPVTRAAGRLTGGAVGGEFWGC